MNPLWTSSPAQNTAPSKRRNRQECDPKSYLEKYLQMKNLINHHRADRMSRVPSSPSMLGLVRQICHHAEVDSNSICSNKRCDRDVGHQMAIFATPRSHAEVAAVCTVFIINARTGAANLSSRRGRLKKPVHRVKNMNKTSIMIHLIEQEQTTKPTIKTLSRLPRSHSDHVAER